jgi:hypothetical protein
LRIHETSLLNYHPLVSTGRNDELFGALPRAAASGVSRQTAWAWEPKPEIEAGRIIQHLDSSPMKTGYGTDKTETKSIAGSAAVSLQPIKALENMLVFITWNPRSVIGD